MHHAGGVFRLNVTFSDEYNVVPPLINFMTIPFHPNSKYRYNYYNYIIVNTTMII